MHSQLFVALLQLLDLIGVVLNNIELLLDVLLLFLSLEFHDRFLFRECDHLLLEHLNLISHALEFQVLLLLVCVLDHGFPGSDSLLKRQSLLLAGRQHGPIV